MPLLAPLLLIFMILHVPLLPAAEHKTVMTAFDRVHAFTISLESDLITHQDAIKVQPEKATELLTKHLPIHVDFNLMARYVMGRNWNKAAQSEQQEISVLFSHLLIRFYSNALINYLEKNTIQSGMIELLPFHDDPKSEYARVKTNMKVIPGAPQVRVNYSLYKTTPRGWMIYDLSVEGVSLVTSYRSSFNDIVKKEGVKGLISHLKAKNTAL